MRLVLPLTLLVGQSIASLAHAEELVSPYAEVEQMSHALALIDHLYVEPADRQKLISGALRGLVAELDPHSAYMDPNEFAEFESSTEGRFAGIGVEVDFRDGQVTVLAPIEGSPADRAGILPGDRILAVGGHPIRGAKVDRIIDLMRGPVGTTVRLTIGREGSDEPKIFEVTRAIVAVASVESKRLSDGTVYLRLKQFQETSHDELLEHVGKLKAAAPIPRVILDLRYNPGGLVDQAELIADEFLSEGTIYSTRHRGRIIDQVDAASGGALSTPSLVVLLNEFSASASELLAGALQDHRRATVIGVRSFGKGSVQTILNLPYGAGMRLTTMRYYTPLGRAIQARGIDPDIALEEVTPPETFRESDLEGHLENNEERAPRPGQIIVRIPKRPPTSLRLADIPQDPAAGDDPFLKAAMDFFNRTPIAR